MQIDFNPDQHQPADPNRVPDSLLPKGWYLFSIRSSELRRNNDNQGSHIWLELVSVDSAYPGLAAMKDRYTWGRSTSRTRTLA